LKPQKPPDIIIAKEEYPIVIESDNNDISFKAYHLSLQQCMTDHLGNLKQPLAEPSKANDCFWSKILSLQSDFVSERPLLQLIIKEFGHIFSFLPKFHCELNPIELFWLYIKNCEFCFNHLSQIPS
jgi:hypothetical protein